MDEPKLPRLIKAAQVELEYGIKRRTLVSYVKHNVIGCVRLGRQIFYDRKIIESFIESGGKGFPNGGWRREAV